MTMIQVFDPDPNGIAEAVKQARSLREEFRKRGVFTIDEYKTALAGRLKDLDPSTVNQIAGVIDYQSVNAWEIAHGWEESPPEFDMEGEYKLRNGRRVAKRLCLREHMEESLALGKEELAESQRETDEARANLRQVIQETLDECETNIATCRHIAKRRPHLAAAVSPDTNVSFYLLRYWAKKALAAIDAGEEIPPSPDLPEEEDE